MTGKAASTVPTGEPMVTKPIDATTTAAVVGLTDSGTQSQGNCHPDSGVVEMEAQIGERNGLQPFFWHKIIFFKTIITLI